jgi:FkbM family methyltransferase
MGKNVYIEAGVYSFSSTAEKFLKENSHKEWEVHLFEPSPCRIRKIKAEINLLKDFNIVLYPVAIFNENVEKILYEGKWGRGQASTMFEGKRRSVLYNNPVKISCIDFNEWIIKNFNRDDYIYLRMDIEGAEYIVLPHLIKNNTMGYFNKLDIEFHASKFRGDNGTIFKKIHSELKEYFNNHKSNDFVLWRL